MMPCVGYLFVAIAKFYKIERYKPVFINLISELREMWPEDNVTDEEQVIISSALNRLRLVTKTYFYCNLILAFIFTLPANINLIKSLFGIEVPRILPFVYWMPFDPSKKVVFEVVLIVQNIHCFLSAAYMLAGDLLFFVFLSHITTQFSLLAVRIQKMFYVPIDGQLPESYPLGYYNKENSLNNPNQDTANNRCKVEEEELKNIVIRHKALIRLSNDVENMYSFSLLVNFLNSSIIICFCLFCCAFVEKWNEFNYKIFFITAISQIWILCWYGQHLVDTSTGVGEALYNSAWYVSSNSIKKSILIMIHRSQRRVHITTFGFSTVSMECYATILKTSWSYFTLLINLYNT
nr:odorant receptor 4-like [Danaus plexippus plexippus]